jgi:phosphoglycolate phosphatase
MNGPPAAMPRSEKEPCFEAVIFDFDYTLVDSSRGAVACIGYALAEMGLPPVSDADACRTIGLSLPETLRVLTGEADPEQGATFEALFIAHAEEVMTPRTVLLPATRDTVARLRRDSYRLAIVSTKYRRRIREILAREGMLAAFEVIVGGEDVSRCKPHPEGLTRALQMLGDRQPLSRECVLYVGDSLTDARTAERAGLPFAAVLTGTTPRAAFAPYAPLGVLDDLSELPRLLSNHSAERSRP